MRRFSERKDGVFQTDEIDRIVQQCLPLISTSKFVKFASHFTMRRAFLYALVCKENNFSTNLVEFLSGCNRYGLDNPAPTIHKRVNLYGNEDDFEDIIKKELEHANITV